MKTFQIITNKSLFSLYRLASELPVHYGNISDSLIYKWFDKCQKHTKNSWIVDNMDSKDMYSISNIQFSN